jgi:hypothetical protein
MLGLPGTGDGLHVPRTKIERVYHMPGDIGNEQAPFAAIQTDIVRLDQSGLCDGADDAGPCIDAADTSVAPIDDKEITGAVERNPIRFIQAGPGRGAAITREGRLSSAGHGVDAPASRIDPTNAVVERVGKEQIASPVERQIERAVHPNLCRRPVIAGVSGFAGTDHRFELRIVHSRPVTSKREASPEHGMLSICRCRRALLVYGWW